MSFKTPLTPAEAKAKKYGRRFEQVAYKEGFCAEQVSDYSYRAPSVHQCTRKSGFGPHKLYCKSHARQYGRVDGDNIQTVFYHESGRVWEVQVLIQPNQAKVLSSKVLFGGDWGLYKSYLKHWVGTAELALKQCMDYHKRERASALKEAADHLAKIKSAAAYIVSFQPAQDDPKGLAGEGE